MSVIIEADQIKHIDFSGASIYLDACFIITYLDKDDSRQGDVIDALGIWAEYDGVRLAVSNHTVSEVINRIFHTLILTSIETYHHHKHAINNQRNGYDRLPDVAKEKLVDLESAKFIYKVAKETGLLDIYRNQKVSAKVNDLIKAVKEDYAYSTKRHLLDIFYNKAVNIYSGFYFGVTQRLGVPIDIKASRHDEYDLALSHMRILQLDSTDAFHLAIARNQCDFLATLDSDFVHNIYDKITDFDTIILKVS